MKILLIHNIYQQRGGEDSVLENEYEMLSKKGNQVEKLLFQNKDIQSSLDKIKAGIFSFYNPTSVALLEKKIKKFTPDIIHVHNFFPIASPSIFYTAHRYNIPIVMTLHNYRLICPNALLFREGEPCEKCVRKSFPIDGVLHGCYRSSKLQTFSLASMVWMHKILGTWYKKIDKYITLTNFAKTKILNSSLEIPEEKIIVKPNFVEDRGFEFCKDNYFLYVGRLTEEKGVKTLLNAFMDTDKKLEIIGSGPLEQDVLKAVRLNKNIIYHGFQSPDFIITKLKKARALIFPSMWYEGMPMTILEAFSCATPVVCGNIGAAAEMVKNEVNGLTFEAGNSLALKEKIEWISNNPDKISDFSHQARFSYEEIYNEEKNYKYLINIYKNLMKDQPNPMKC